MRVCNLTYTACNAHAPYCHLWPVDLGHICSHYLINGTILEKIVIEHKNCVLSFSTKFVWNISHYKKKWSRYDHKCTYRGADKSLTRPGRKQATATEDFDVHYAICNHNWMNISTIYVYIYIYIYIYITRLTSNEIFSPANKIQGSW